MFKTLSRYLTATAGALTVTFILANPAVLKADDGSGVEAFERGDYAEALPDLSRAAEAGDPRAQLYLGQIYSKAEGDLANSGKALYWLNCAAKSSGDISDSARDLLLRLGDGLTGGARESRGCPRLGSTVSDFDAGQSAVGTPLSGRLEAARQFYSARRGRVEKSLTEKIRENSFGSILMLPGEATIEIGHSAARTVGAKTVAYYIDETRQPGNDIGYLLIVFLSWLLLYKAVMIVFSIANRIGPRGISADVDQQNKMDRKFLSGSKKG